MASNRRTIYEGDMLRDERGEILPVSWGEAEWLAGRLALNANKFFEGKSRYLESSVTSTRVQKSFLVQIN